jgi:alkylation response protein AidB-like acyl-CoA dehydrogenase
MKNPQFTDEENEIVATVERFVERSVRPRVADCERDKVYPLELVDEMRELGLYGLAVPEEFGGLGLRIPVLATVMEVIARGWTTLGAYINSHATVCYAIATSGTTEQKAKFLPSMATGDHRGSLCLTEPGGGSDLQAIRSIAKPAGDHYLVSGSKTYVTNGQRATLVLMLVKHPKADSEPKQRISLLLVEKALPGITVTSHFHKMGFSLVDTVQIEFDGARISTADLLGGVEGRGFSQLMDSLEIGRIAIGASAVGLAANALSEARRYAGERKTFGVAIDQHQAIQLKLAEMATDVVSARLIVAEAARLKEAGGRCDMISAMAKMFASEAALRVVTEAVRVHGGAGYISDYPVERLYREALLYVVGEGTNEINKLVVARRLQNDAELEYLGLVR